MAKDLIIIIGNKPEDLRSIVEEISKNARGENTVPTFINPNKFISETLGQISGFLASTAIGHGDVRMSRKMYNEDLEKVGLKLKIQRDYSLNLFSRLKDIYPVSKNFVILYNIPSLDNYVDVVKHLKTYSSNIILISTVDDDQTNAASEYIKSNVGCDPHVIKFKDVSFKANLKKAVNPIKLSQVEVV